MISIKKSVSSVVSSAADRIVYCSRGDQLSNLYAVFETYYFGIHFGFFVEFFDPVS